LAGLLRARSAAATPLLGPPSLPGPKLRQRSKVMGWRPALALRALEECEGTDEAQEEAEEPPARGLFEPDDRPLGEAALDDPEVRETALYYLTKRQKIEDEKFQTEQEWIHLFSVVGDLGRAMEMGAEKDALEAKLEEMSEREQEVAEQLVEIRSLRKNVREGKGRLGGLQEELQKEGTTAAALRAELGALQRKCDDEAAEVARLQVAQKESQSQIEAAQEALTKAADEGAALREAGRELQAQVVEAEAAVGPRHEERDRLQQELTELQARCDALEADALKEAKELEEGRAEAERLRAEKSAAEEKAAALQREVGAQQALLNALPKELSAANAELERLASQTAELEKAVAPEQAKVAALRAECRATQEQVETLQAERLFLEKEAKVAEDEANTLSAEQQRLRAEVAELGKQLAGAKGQARHLEQRRPELVAERDRMLEQVASAVEEVRASRGTLLAEAMAAQTRLQDMELERAMAEEQLVLQSTAREVEEAASAVFQSTQEAQTALEQAVALRARAEVNFARLSEAAGRRTAALKQQEEALAASAESQQGLAAELQALLETTTGHSRSFEAAQGSLDTFTEHVREARRESEEEPASPIGLMQGALGMFGSLVAAGAKGAAKATQSNTLKAGKTPPALPQPAE